MRFPPRIFTRSLIYSPAGERKARLIIEPAVCATLPKTSLVAALRAARSESISLLRAAASTLEATILYPSTSTSRLRSGSSCNLTVTGIPVISSEVLGYIENRPVNRFSDASFSKSLLLNLDRFLSRNSSGQSVLSIVISPPATIFLNPARVTATSLAARVLLARIAPAAAGIWRVVNPRVCSALLVCLRKLSS